MAYGRVCSAYNEDQEATRFLCREEILCINKVLNWTEKDTNTHPMGRSWSHTNSKASCWFLFVKLVNLNQISDIIAITFVPLWFNRSCLEGILCSNQVAGFCIGVLSEIRSLTITSSIFINYQVILWLFVALILENTEGRQFWCTK